MGKWGNGKMGNGKWGNGVWEMGRWKNGEWKIGNMAVLATVSNDSDGNDLCCNAESKHDSA